MIRRAACCVALTVLIGPFAGRATVAQTTAAPRGATAQQAARKPNIVFILGDDLGYCDVSMYGCHEIPTPNIDSIASRGVKFTQAYVSAPVCSPSRAGMLTGRYQQRFGFEFNAGPLARATTNLEMGLPTTEIMLPQVLKQAGYVTGMVGKWHLGMHARFQPNQRGFDEYFGFLFGANTYINPNARGVFSAVAGGGEGAPAWPRAALNPIYRNQDTITETDYLTDAFAREAVAFIEKHKQEPFFLYAPFNAPHTPFQVTQKYYDRFPNVKDESRRVYSAMVSALDDGVGAILNKLRESGLENDTLVVFLSDNGCATYTNACTNDPLRLGKLTHLEGGLRVPFAMRWPGRLSPGAVYERPIVALDLFPTAVALAGGKLPADRPLDGVDLMPYLTGANSAAPHESLYWRNGPNAAVRQGNLKLFKGGDHYWLFDLSQDVGEQKNLADQQPESVERLKKALSDWELQLKEPMWPCRKANGDWELDGVKLDICI